MTQDQIISKSRFAFDLGTNSIGWAVYRLDKDSRPCELVDCGVRLFSDGRNPKDGQSLAAMRRAPRAARRRRDRFVQRRDWLMALLVRHGLMPTDETARSEVDSLLAQQNAETAKLASEAGTRTPKPLRVEADETPRKALEKLDPYRLRAKALQVPLAPFEIGRLLFQLNQRRGYQSNRIADAKNDDNDKGKIAAAGEQLSDLLAGRTLGQYYADRQSGPVRGRKGVRARLQGQGAQAFYEIYPQREMLKDEFDRIWSFQSVHHPSLLTDAARAEIRETIFHQRPLKPPIVGRCTFLPEEFRLSVAHPIAQAFRIYQELANIDIEEGLERPRRLTLPERDLLASRLLAGEDLSFGKLRRLLDLGGAAKINLEEGGRDKLKGDECARRLGDPKSGRLRRLWPGLSPEHRAEVILHLLEDDTAALSSWLIADVGANEEEAREAARFHPPEGHIRLGLTAASAIIEELKRGDRASDRTIPYSEACARVFPHHSDFRTGEVFDRLPDYRTVLERHTIGGSANPDDPEDKRLGRVPNPTVHIGLNQLRRVINALIETYGNPEQVVLELARELKQTKEDKDRAQKENRKNEEANRRRAADLETAGLAVSPANIRLMRLWEDLGPLPRLCTYTGKPISFSQVFTDEIEVEHILPFSRTLDDSMANKTLAYREANRGKRNLAPEEADWSNVAGGYEAIQQRASALPRNKAWRFKPGAMEKYTAEKRDFLARQLNETRHLSRLAKEYVAGVTRDQNAVWVVTGQLTALLRARWGLNFSNVKDRNNHRHHAIDAATIGVIDRGLLNSLARKAASREEDDRLEEITKDVPEPPGFLAVGRDFRQNVRERTMALVVSHKAEHGIGGALHEDTAYGLIDPGRGEDGNLVYRKAIEDLKAPEIGRVRDLGLRASLTNLLEDAGGKSANATQLSEALRAFGKANNIRRVRLLKSEASVVSIHDRSGRAYKALIPGDNHHMDIVEGPDGNWRGFAATVFDVNQKGFVPRWKAELPGARLMFRVHKGDMLELEDDGERRIKRVVRINPSERRLYLAGHDDGGELAKRHADATDPFRWDLASVSKLKDRRCRLVTLNALGQIPRL